MAGYEVNAPNKVCPACEGLVPTAAALCTRCGLNFETGMRVTPAAPDAADAERKAALLKKARKTGDLDTLARLGAKPAGVSCAECGYDVTGLTGRPCPECGHTRRTNAGRQKRREEQIRRYWLAAVLTAAIGTPLGLGATLFIGVACKGWSVTDGLVHVALCEAALFVAYFVMSFFFLGFEEDIRGLALRLVGVAAVWAALWTWTSLLMVGGFYAAVLIPAMLAALVLAAPLKLLTGRDWDDCYWIAGAAWILRFVAGALLNI
ncbi:MAG TPA: hypothetical protein VEB22_00990 [Phycisphaerales bacterium]|nr:hypothetical protein [Phycisphaerales bacterium]